MTSEHTKPKLRSSLDIQPVYQNDEAYLLLRDPLELSSSQLVVPQTIAPLLSMLDGSLDAVTLRASFAMRFQQWITPDALQDLLGKLDEAYLLENERYFSARDSALVDYHAANSRPPDSAGKSYPSDQDDLRKLIDGYVQNISDREHVINSPRGIVSPHIDYARGGRVYAEVWNSIAPALQDFDLIIILGTDHYGEARITLTRQDYATPFGLLPTAQDEVAEIAQAIGEESAFKGELYHRGEHSIELAAVWMHYFRQENPPEILPILCGSFFPLIFTGEDPNQDPVYVPFVKVLRSVLHKRKVLLVAAGDLAHIGPAFGGPPIDESGKQMLKRSDEDLISHMCAGDSASFLASIRAAKDQNNVCGLGPIYLTMQALQPTRGIQAGYDQCQADENGTSWVSICGIIFQ